jgi:hypothetical protein
VARWSRKSFPMLQREKWYLWPGLPIAKSIGLVIGVRRRGAERGEGSCTGSRRLQKPAVSVKVLPIVWK